MVFILNGSSEHAVRVRSKLGLFWRKNNVLNSRQLLMLTSASHITKNLINFTRAPSLWLPQTIIYFYLIFYSTLIMIFILDGCSFHVAHVWRSKQGLFPKKIGFDDSFDVTECLQQIEMPDLLHVCAEWNEQPSNIKTIGLTYL